MARGQRTSLADLAKSVGDNSPVERLTAAAPTAPGQLPLKDLVANPRNPREDVGDLEDLASIAEIQLQPALAITKKAYLALYPDDEVAARYVVVNGCRRLAAAAKFGRTDLVVVVNDEVARDRVTLIAASIAENVDRQDFDVIEEAKAVETLTAECGSADEAARRLHRSKGWVSQRRALLGLAPELRTALRRGELAIREARSLARVPLEQQVVRWQAAQDKWERRGEERDATPPIPTSPSRLIAKAFADFEAKPEALAGALKTHLGDTGIATLIALWSR